MSDPSSLPSSCLGLDGVSDLHRPTSVYDEMSMNDGGIRLLQIEPADNTTTQIVTRLFKASLENAPPYEAVSYRWEQPEDSHFIIVNKTKFPVMRNVLSFLSDFDASRTLLRRFSGLIAFASIKRAYKIGMLRCN